MRIKNLISNHAGKAVIEPDQVIRERHQQELGPSCEIPAAAIVCYDRKLWEWVCTMPGRVACDGWLSGAWLLPKGDQP